MIDRCILCDEFGVLVGEYTPICVSCHDKLYPPNPAPLTPEQVDSVKRLTNMTEIDIELFNVDDKEE